MAYTAAEARTQMLDDMAVAGEELSLALACLTEAYEALDEDAGDALERSVFGPVQASYGRLKRTMGTFAQQYGLPARGFAERSPGAHSSDPKIYIERAIDAVHQADQAIAELQDSMLPVEVGNADLRAGLSGTRELLSNVPGEGRRLLRTFGR